ncbi:hypothetical protein GC093_20460 [Paenibacillus sp. LMG 31456]|uniref:DUF2634 domain-containing protein n=1 Tax=Paenibacillus foliorum TaxID=2654974 RepID=A0A972GRP4_9BACL|nr:hypothetical protein [Paenibacillus foliorum]NOU95584.1 hypothetical protein [Paenibacillus foliorum]
MKYRALDTNGDYSFGKSQQNFISGVSAVAQALKTNLLLLQGEWWESIDKGLPLFQNILGQPGTPANVQATDLLVKEAIANTPGVTIIKNFKSIYENRTYSLSCTVNTQNGNSIQVTVTDLGGNTALTFSE